MNLLEVKVLLRNLAIFLGATLFLISCNITYKVRNQYNDIEHLVHFPCGKVSIELIGRGNSKFLLRQNFNLDEEIFIYLDSVKICYNDQVIKANYKSNNSKFGQKGFYISGNKSLETAFELNKGVFEGDTVLVFSRNYLKCIDDSIALDTIIYSFRNNIRIRGVNDL